VQLEGGAQGKGGRGETILSRGGRANCGNGYLGPPEGACLLKRVLGGKGGEGRKVLRGSKQ